MATVSRSIGHDRLYADCVTAGDEEEAEDVPRGFIWTGVIVGFALYALGLVLESALPDSLGWISDWPRSLGIGVSALSAGYGINAWRARRKRARRSGQA